jgi:hypothetical protein
MKVFGREPALILGLAGAVLAWAVSLGLDWLNAGQATAIVALLTAVLMAVTTRPIAPALYAGVISAGAAVFAEYGLNWSEASVTGLGAVILAGFALFGVRPQVTPSQDQAPTALSTGQVR